jgi:alpha-maltose-1-phosphate synthase
MTQLPANGKLRVALLTREYPPEVYGGAGVHVTYLARELAPLVDLTVHCQGADRPDAVAHRPWDLLAGANQALQVVSTDLSMAAAVGPGMNSAQLVHSHTWYANLAGHLAAMLYGVPHVMTMHSLEALRPWKAEQLGGGYAVSTWCERTAASSAAAVVAVSDGMRADIMTAYPEISAERIRVIRNGIDTSEYHPDPNTDVLERYGIDTGRPYVIFVGRITRQKGVPVLLRATSGLVPEAQLVLLAGAADTPEQLTEVTELVDGLRATRSGVFWIPEMLPKREVIQLLTHATVFACPSIYEPLGIVNLEAMACGTAVVGSRTGGIPEVVADGETGLLVPAGEPEPLAVALNTLLGDPDRAEAMGQAGRKRAVAEFGWPAIAAQTADLYAELVHSGLKRLPSLDDGATAPPTGPSWRTIDHRPPALGERGAAAGRVVARADGAHRCLETAGRRPAAGAAAEHRR